MDIAMQLATIGSSLCTMALMGYSLWRMIALTAEAREARGTALAATVRAEEAARLAAGHAAETAQVIVSLGGEIKELAVNTNSIKDALIASTAKASDLEGEKRGREQEVERAAAAAAAEKK